MKAKQIAEGSCACKACRNGSHGCRDYPDGRIPVGTIIERPDAWKLVQMGLAVPADEECSKAAAMTDRQMQEAQYAQKRASLGIHPDDFEAYDAGDMIGYDRNGNAIPGPNATLSEGGLILDGGFDDEWEE